MSQHPRNTADGAHCNLSPNSVLAEALALAVGGALIIILLPPRCRQGTSTRYFCPREDGGAHDLSASNWIHSYRSCSAAKNIPLEYYSCRQTPSESTEHFSPQHFPKVVQNGPCAADREDPCNPTPYPPPRLPAAAP